MILDSLHPFRYEVVEKKSLQTWRKYVGEVTAQKQMDVATFLDALSTSSQETAKRMEVPDKKLDKTLSKAEKVNFCEKNKSTKINILYALPSPLYSQLRIFPTPFP